jgi:hypothetical protein
MNKVIDKASTYGTIVTTQCNQALYYAAIVNSSTREKGIVIRSSFDRGHYQLHSLRSLTNGNMINLPEITRLPEFLEYLLSKNIEVYEFVTFDEMAKWLISTP